MIKCKRIALLILTGIICTFGPVSATEKEIVLGPFPSDIADIPSDQLDTLREQALAGSIDAAKRLGGFYLWKLHDYEQGAHWRAVQAENGDLNARFEVAILMARKEDVNSRIRARFWLNKLIKEGPAELRELARDGLSQVGRYDTLYGESSQK